MNYYPNTTALSVRLSKVFKTRESIDITERMSSRMVRCASALADSEMIGWQMFVPRKGMVELTAFGSKSICSDDLDWILEKTGETSGRKFTSRVNPEELSVLYELYLPVFGDMQKATIGFEKTIQKADEPMTLWPNRYSNQFQELIRALQTSGAALRIVIGSASEEEQDECRKHTLATITLPHDDALTYIAKPVRMRVLFCLPSAPTILLQTILQQAVPQARLKLLGNLRSRKVRALWDNPLTGAPVIPETAARILMLEPQLEQSIIGLEACDEAMKLIPASHKNAKSSLAVEIGSAVDVTGAKRKITIDDMDLRRHYQIIGQTGTGKSTLLCNIVLSAIKKGYPLTFFDPHGTTVDMILRSVPEQFADRIRVVRIGNEEYPVPLNIWDSGDYEKEERNIADLCELFEDLFDPNHQGFVGPRYERWLSTFTKASLALLGNRASLESITVLSQSKRNMEKLYEALKNRCPFLAESIKQEYLLDNSNEFNWNLSWYLSKFQRLTSVSQLRNSLGAGANALDFKHTIDTDTVTLIDLAMPTIGVRPARIIGTLTLMKLWNAALERECRDRTHLVLLDEASLFQAAILPRMLAESRKFGLSMVLCHQHSGQLSTEIQEALEANSANFSAFRLSPSDAKTAVVRFDDFGLSNDLTRLDAFYAVTSISVKGKQTDPFTLHVTRPGTRWNCEEVARSIEQRSYEKLVLPYLSQRALSPEEIQHYLDYPERIGWNLKTVS